jgi:predicted dehydrogenase/threonine dehydrogenase-like Zn-dependent dehydrogenase
MRQILQSLKTGQITLGDVPCPKTVGGHLLIRSCQSLISAGTERMLLEFGKANLLNKARQQPEKVLMVLDKIKTDGLMPTIASVKNKLDQPLTLGYCNVGVVVEMGPRVSAYRIGDRVASNGKHAEIVTVPENLCAKIPDEVSDESAAFTVIGAIALQGIRLAQPTLGEAFVVTGLGLVGLMAVQLLRSHGCRVLGIDLDGQRLELARRFGAETVDLSRGEDPVAASRTFSRGRGVDGVLITASTSSNEPVHQAAQMCRKRGRIVLVGVVGLELSRADFYEKELSFQVSCSYGPGRYDANYEERGQDYPIGFVRWTEQRNFEAVLDLLADRRLDAASLITHRIPLDQAEQAYQLLTDDKLALGIIIDYAASNHQTDDLLRTQTVTFATPKLQPTISTPIVAFIGAGNYATQVLIPAFKKTGVRLHSIASTSGISSVHAGRAYGFQEASTDTGHIISNPDIDAIVIATRHDSHAQFVCEALNARKHVFVEKPLALNRQQLAEIETSYTSVRSQDWTPILMVGFNRRFAPQVQKIRTLLAAVREPKALIMTVNAGAVAPDHWTQDPAVGGGRIIGEACHFVDLLKFLIDASITSVQATMLGKRQSHITEDDRVTFTLEFADGSVGTVHYLANGHRSFPKERLEVFCGGRILQLDNFRQLRGYGWPRFKRLNLWQQDKGNQACAAAFVEAIRQGKPSPIPFHELLATTLTTFAVMEALKSNEPVLTGTEKLFAPAEPIPSPIEHTNRAVN